MILEECMMGDVFLQFFTSVNQNSHGWQQQQSLIHGCPISGKLILHQRKSKGVLQHSKYTDATSGSSSTGKVKKLTSLIQYLPYSSAFIICKDRWTLSDKEGLLTAVSNIIKVMSHISDWLLYALNSWLTSRRMVANQGTMLLPTKKAVI